MSGEGLLLTTSFWACFAVWAVVDRAVSPSLGARTGAVLTTGVSWLFLLAFTGIALEALVGLAAALLLVYAAAGSFVAGGRAAAGFGALLGLVLGVWSLGKVGSSLDLGPLITAVLSV